MMILLGFIGLGIDGAAVYAKRQHVQTGADAAAFAVAQEYALTGCVEDEGLALTYAKPNVPNENDTTGIDKVVCEANSVQVVASAEQPPFFLQAVGADPIRVPASATVEWGSPIEGTSVIPIAISYCSYWDAFGDANIGDTVNLNIPQPSDLTSGCDYGDYPAGGFSWLDPTGGCEAFTSVGNWVPGDTGNNVPSECSVADFLPLIDRLFLLPVFDDNRGVGSGGEYHIAGYAGVILRSFHFNTLSGNPKSGGTPACAGLPTGPTMCMLLEFQGYQSIDEEFILGPVTDPNTLVIRLKD